MKNIFKAEYNTVKTVSCLLKSFDYLSRDNDYITVTNWVNGEGWDINIGDRHFTLTYGELEAINYLIKSLELYEPNKA